MTPELTILTLAALLQVVQFALFAIPANMELGAGYTSSARDRPPSKPLSEKTARLQRAMTNHFEGLILFSIATVVITFSDQGNAITALCATAYLIARILYIPAYYFGLRPWRSLIWAVGFCATVLMLLAALF
ncbi:membrane protein [Puniceibacterium antarcticum]|uniref:Membrane protein n=1 Tax=Puniceibacterium antarcticum TaxID=1206336 RepID=A0A2G8R910_9RHOB|nr:MAPEG family protein [Puniceibacterium antarcticum]PIL17931.1 membrane protein [Puniceibacterium antarcticum]